VDASDVSCQVVLGLLGLWHDGALDDHDREVYEQHLLFCPPCLVHHDKFRRALKALSEYGTSS
jgi:hypothetical protein